MSVQLWQRSMIRLARHDRVRAWAERAPGAHQAAARFVGGESAQVGVATARRLRDDHGITASLFYLGEYIADPELVEVNVMEAIAAAESLGGEGLDVHVSVDPTAIGFLCGEELARRNAERIARAVAAAADGGRTAVMLDMEDLSLVEPTLVLHRHLVAAGLPAAITLQARLRRTAHDLEDVVRMPTSIRLVKGAFPRGAAEDHQGREAIDAAYLELARTMLSVQARQAGVYPVFATHDDALARRIIATAQDEDWAPHQYEFEMLYGGASGLATRAACSRDLGPRLPPVRQRLVALRDAPRRREPKECPPDGPRAPWSLLAPRARSRLGRRGAAQRRECAAAALRATSGAGQVWETGITWSPSRGAKSSGLRV